MTFDEVLAAFKNYKYYVALKEDIELTYDYVKTSTIKDVPGGSSTNKDTLAQQLAKKQSELAQIDFIIRRIENWLNYLSERERHYMQHKFINGYSILMVNAKWQAIRKGNWYSQSKWYDIRNEAINKIVEITKKNPLS